MNNEIFKRILSSLILIPLTFFFIIKGSYLFIFFLLICLIITIYEWHMMSKKKNYLIYGYFFILFSFYSIYLIRSNPDENSLFIFFLITVTCISTDIGGFIFGKVFKGPKLTLISPKKTYSGVFGGYFLSIIFSIYFVKFSYLLFNINNDFNTRMLFYTLFISTISQIGDIIISYFKRLSNIKDTGKLIPGHGGILDRIDGMIFAFPLFFFLKFLGF